MGKKIQLEPPCSCAHWLFIPFITNEIAADEEDLMIIFTFINMICRCTKELPEIIMSSLPFAVFESARKLTWIAQGF